VRSRPSLLLHFLFFTFASLTIARLCIPDAVLNLFMNYSIDDRVVGGESSIFEKLHPATWGLFLLAAIAIRGASARFDQERQIFISLAIFGTTVVSMLLYSVVRGQTISLGYLVDNFIVSCAACLIMISFPERWRNTLGHILLLVVLINSVVALGEFAVGEHVVPYRYEQNEYSFRAMALFGHPLALGGINAGTVSFVWLTKWSQIRKFLSVGLLIAGCLAAGARFSSLITLIAGVIPFFVVRHSRRNRDASLKTLVLILVVVGLPLALVAAEGLGLLQRFQSAGLYDESAESRVKIFQIFNYIDLTDLLFGAGLDKLNKYVTLGLNTLVENSFVILIFQFGAILTLVWFTALANVFRALAGGAGIAVKLAILAYILLLFSGPIGKDASLMLLLLLCLAFRRVGIQQQSG
jgi:hypothetical protein